MAQNLLGQDNFREKLVVTDIFGYTVIELEDIV
jgi:hypothetical protein